MTNFTDGPAKGKVLCLGRAPLFLRVVQCGDDAFDALDMPDDTPEPTEQIYVYHRTTPKEKVGVVHVDFSRGSKRCSAWYRTADYAIFSEQPEERILRDNELWQAWCKEKAGLNDGAKKDQTSDH